LATTGTRPIQAARLEVGDLQVDRGRLMMPRSGKGDTASRDRRRERTPVPIPAALAAKLAAAAAGRGDDAPLLDRGNSLGGWLGAGGRQADYYRKPFRELVGHLKLPGNLTPYALRHGSIVRMLLANVPVRLVASLHDTSVAMIEKHYSKYINDHADVITRRAMLDFSAGDEQTNNVVPLRG
jgi:integrase